MTQDDRDMSRALETLRVGGVIAYPTDTVWGIGCDATIPEAVARVYAIKRRQDAKALVTLAADRRMLLSHIPEGTLVPDIADSADTDRPVTVVYPHAHGLAPNLLAQDGSAAIRIPRDPWCRRLAAILGAPVVSTSANVSGQPAPTRRQDLDPAITGAVDYVCQAPEDDGVQRHRRPSRIMRVESDGSLTVLRP